MNFLETLQEEKSSNLRGGIYHKTQIQFTYNTNRIEGSKLSEEQTRYIYETNTLFTENGEETTNINELLKNYNEKNNIKVFDIIEFHYGFESIHPFQDGNGRVGRLIMFKECLKHNIVPFIIADEFKFFYYRGLSEYPKVKGYLTDTCLPAQDKYVELMNYFEIER